VRTIVHIRRAGPDDANRIAELHRASIQTLCADAYTPDQIAGWIEPLTPGRYLSGMAQFEFFVAETDRVIGFCILSTDESELYAIYFDPETTGNGYGRMLMRYAEDVARTRGVTELKLKSTLNAVGFYGRCGYRKVGDTSHTSPTGLQLPCVEMVKSL